MRAREELSMTVTAVEIDKIFIVLIKVSPIPLFRKETGYW